MPSYLFTLTITPVQSFITQARKTKDLFAGSEILSNIIRNTINKATKEYKAEIIFPQDTEIVSNKFVAEFQNISEENIRDIYKELIREALFEKLGDELPYQSDILIDKIEEYENLDKVYATIIIERPSQKGMIIGKKGRKIKEIGVYARKLLEQFSGKKIYLELYVKVISGWTKNKKMLEELGYEVEL